MPNNYENGRSKPLSYGEQRSIEEMRKIDKVGEADRRRVAEVENVRRK
jgi:hypothetical protein